MNLEKRVELLILVFYPENAMIKSISLNFLKHKGVHYVTDNSREYKCQ